MSISTHLPEGIAVMITEALLGIEGNHGLFRGRS